MCGSPRARFFILMSLGRDNVPPAPFIELNAKSSLLNLSRANAWEVTFTPQSSSTAGTVAVIVHVRGDVDVVCSSGTCVSTREAEGIASSRALQECNTFLDRHIDTWGTSQGSLQALRRLAVEWGFRVSCWNGYVSVHGTVLSSADRMAVSALCPHDDCIACFTCPVCKWSVSSVSCAGHGFDTVGARDDAAAGIQSLLLRAFGDDFYRGALPAGAAGGSAGAGAVIGGNSDTLPDYSFRQKVLVVGSASSSSELDDWLRSADLFEMSAGLTPAGHCRAVGLDFERDPQSSRLLVVQIATRDTVLVARWPTSFAYGSPLLTLLCDSTVLKYGKDLMHDWTEVSVVCNAAGFECTTMASAGWREVTLLTPLLAPSCPMSSVCRLALGVLYPYKSLSKRDSTFHSAWGAWPLSDFHIEYAAADACVCYDIFEAMSGCTRIDLCAICCHPQPSLDCAPSSMCLTTSCRHSLCVLDVSRASRTIERLSKTPSGASPFVDVIVPSAVPRPSYPRTYFRVWRSALGYQSLCSESIWLDAPRRILLDVPSERLHHQPGAVAPNRRDFPSVPSSVALDALPPLLGLSLDYLLPCDPDTFAGHHVVAGSVNVHDIVISTRSPHGAPLRSWDWALPAARAFVSGHGLSLRRQFSVVPASDTTHCGGGGGVDASVRQLRCRVVASGGAMACPMAMLCSQSLYALGDPIEHTTAPWELLQASLRIVAACDSDDAASGRPHLTCKSAFTPRDSFHISVWDPGPTDVLSLYESLCLFGVPFPHVACADARRRATVFTFCAMLELAYQAPSVDWDEHVAAGLDTEFALCDRELFASVVPALLCGKGPASSVLYCADGGCLRVFSPHATEREDGVRAVPAHEWLWPLHALPCIKHVAPVHDASGEEAPAPAPFSFGVPLGGVPCHRRLLVPGAV